MRGMNSQFSASTQPGRRLWMTFLFASLELVTSGSPRIALAQQAFCANSQNDPQCETFLRTQRARCEAEGRIWDANQNACNSARELTDPVRQVIEQNAGGRDQMGAQVQQARDQANRATQTLQQLGNENLRYWMREAEFPGQPILVGLPRHLDVFTQNFLPTLFYEKIRENSWFTPYDIELPEQNPVEIFNRSKFGCLIRASYRIQEGHLSVGYEPGTTQIEIFPKVDRPGIFQVNMNSRIRLGGRVRVRLTVKSCVNDASIDLEMLVNRVGYSVRAELGVTQEYFYVSRAELLDLSVGSPSNPDGVTVRRLSASDGIVNIIASVMGLEELIRTNVDSVIQGPAVKGRIQELFTAFLPNTVQSLASLTYLGEPYPGIVTQIKKRGLGHHDSIPGLVSAFTVDIGNMRTADCAQNLSNGVSFYTIFKRPGFSEDTAFMTVPYHLIGDTAFAALKIGAACQPIPDLRFGNFTLQIEPGFSGKLRLKTRVFGTREGNITTGMKWDHPLERGPDDQATSPVSLEIPLAVKLTVRTAGLSAPGSPGLQSLVRTTVTAPLRLWFDGVSRQFKFAVITEGVTLTPLVIDNPLFAQQWNRLPNRDEKLREVVTLALNQIPSLAFSPSYTTLDTRFEARASQLILTPVDITAVLALECTRDCQPTPEQSINGFLPQFSPTGTEAVRDAEFRLQRFLTDPGATDRIPGKLECPRPDPALHAEHGITYGEAEETSCKACIGWSGYNWDLTLRQCIHAPCTLEVSDEERSSCMSCDSQANMSWSVSENRCGVYHSIEERYASCRQEPGYRVRLPGGEALSCIQCVSGGSSWNARTNQCARPQGGIDPQSPRRGPIIIQQ